ncbi:hypothetical protein AMECASPLE_007626 [Ameca splendens]|uniref:Uncharacterized protein n=1 Tax=Ameca splendens TaxID=208324 RepID=A0ABV0YZ59_9TELE
MSARPTFGTLAGREGNLKQVLFLESHRPSALPVGFDSKANPRWLLIPCRLQRDAMLSIRTGGRPRPRQRQGTKLFLHHESGDEDLHLAANSKEDGRDCSTVKL